jgi:hypothetical protein
MTSSERIIGFSTGALAKGDFRRGLSLLVEAHVPAIELSALREHELPELSRSIAGLDLSSFQYVSVHAPSRITDLLETEVIRLLEGAVSLGFPIIVHPDVIESPELWRAFGTHLLIENMDMRKKTGRMASELGEVFRNLPEAGLCFDIGHAHQVDPSMAEAARILREFQSRLREIHASSVVTHSDQGPVLGAARFATSRIAHLIPRRLPIILEGSMEASVIQEELKFARDAFAA